MADNANPKKMNDTIASLNNQLRDLYKTTYFTQDNSEEMKTMVSDRLDDAIRKSTENDDGFNNISNTSRLFQKLMKNASSGAGQKLVSDFGTGKDNDISALFNDSTLASSLMESYTKNKWITQLDNEFDLICKYMTKLQAALDIKRDAVLCSDSFTKQFLNVRAKRENPNSDKNAVIQNNINNLIKTYDLANRAETWYEDTSKYGEEFVYCVPYSSALSELLKKKSNTNYALNEADISFKEVTASLKAALPAGATGSANVVLNESNDPVIKITLDKSKIVKEAVENNYFLQKSSGNEMLRGLSESYVCETDESFNSHLKKSGENTTEVKLDRTIGDEIKWEDNDRTASDGLMKAKEDKNAKIKVNGAVLKTIKHDKVIPIYIEDTLFGCYYIKFDEMVDMDINANSNVNGYNSITSMFNNGQVAGYKDLEPQRDNILSTLAGKLAQRIDAAFINANTNLKREIYLILKYNDKFNQINKSLNMNITFIPADDIHHLKFKEDPDTHRGISDLWDSLVPAKQWIMLNMTSVLGWSTRGFDRRIYYVKQSLDTNTAQSLLHVINTIKKGNFGIRQMESVNNILGVLGRFNDFVIPMGPSGEAPIVFDTQPGQQFDFPNELMGNLEESAVNSTGVPLEIVNSSTAMDFAVRYTMTNAKLLRNVLKRQMKLEDFLSEVFTKLYRFEYNESVELEVTLPPPAFLSMTQGTQLINGAVQYADAITEIEMAGESDEAKQIFKKRVIRKLVPTYLTDEDIEDIKNDIVIQSSINRSKPEEEI